MDSQTDKEKYISDLKTQLSKVVAGQSFHQTEAGQLIIQILTEDVSKFTNDVLSDKFLNDHMGYVDSRAKANYAASLLKRLANLNSPEAEQSIRESLEEAENDG